ncbi:GNAT family N-acetyltransferase [Tuberibacillus sp. Marseille-P3662]|uniref:GNAT family N-acetyltransferase n=1 Tax=Tuberibacillus sp. Marseille-P3662 TaxID=1965358 RepID=UPI000A1C940B|nr:GNAT family N-acetyltransferase [Tuberibacillus sp. Marseille-P3662]
MEYKNVNQLPNHELLNGILCLHESIFKDSDTLITRMESKPKLLITMGLEQGKVVGYKIGYELDSDKFYSWLGGVDGGYRNQGIASELMKTQHNDLKEKGYKIVQTKTKNKWRNMLILNIKQGFNVIRTYTDEKREPKIILEKNL